MFYPEKNKKYVRIRKNHRNYQEEMQKKRNIRRLVLLLLLVIAVALSVVFGVPQRVASLVAGNLHVPFFGQTQEKTPVEEAVPEPEEVEAVPAEEEKDSMEQRALSEKMTCTFSSSMLNATSSGVPAYLNELPAILSMTCSSLRLSAMIRH